MSMTVDLAKAVRDRLNGLALPETITATLVWYPKAELKDIDDLEILVVPRPVETTPQYRGVDQHEFTVDVALQKPIGPDHEIEQVEQMIDLAERLRKSLAGAELEGAPWARWTGSRVDPIFVPEHLHQSGTFTSVIRSTYKALEQR